MISGNDCGHGFASKKTKARCTAVGEPDNAMKRRKALLSEEELLVTKQRDKLRKASKRASETFEQTLHRQEQNRTHMASMRASETFEHRQEQNQTHMASMRASETFEQTVHRQQQDRVHKASIRATETFELYRQEQNRTHMASMRASETFEQTVHRQEQNQTHMASMRASETFEQTVHWQQQDRVHKASIRATETPSEMMQRKHSNKERMSNKRRKSVSVEYAISAFHSEVQFCPDFVCTCCHRMMYRKSVVPCNRVKYTRAGTGVLQKILRGLKAWVRFSRARAPRLRAHAACGFVVYVIIT